MLAGAAGWLLAGRLVAPWAGPPAGAGVGLGTALVGTCRPLVDAAERTRAVERGVPDALYLVGREVQRGRAVERALAVPDAVVSPSRLVVANALDAREAGATIHTHAPVESMRVVDGRVRAVTVGGTLGTTVEADAVVNATGPWAERCAALAGVSVPMRPTRGAMVAVENPGVDAVLNRCRPPADGDIVVPTPEAAVLGTTSVAVDDPDGFERSDAEVDRIVDECAAMAPAVAGAPTVRTYWGVRPLYAPDESGRDGRAISRGFALLDHADDGAAGLVTVVGGKLTTYRRMAEATADLLCDRLAVDAPCRTAERPLPGSDDPERLDTALDRFAVDAPAG